MVNFDEANNEIGKALDVIDYESIPNRIDEIIDSLKEEYAPTIEMTKEDKQSLLDLKSRATFYFFNQSVKKWQQDRIGLQMPYGGLTEDELMQAWLHPESIKVINEGQVQKHG